MTTPTPTPSLQHVTGEMERQFVTAAIGIAESLHMRQLGASMIPPGLHEDTRTFVAGALRLMSEDGITPAELRTMLLGDEGGEELMRRAETVQSTRTAQLAERVAVERFPQDDPMRGAILASVDAACLLYQDPSKERVLDNPEVAGPAINAIRSSLLLMKSGFTCDEVKIISIGGPQAKSLILRGPLPPAAEPQGGLPQLRRKESGWRL